MDAIIGARRDAEAAWENRIPNSAGYLLLTVAFCANMLRGFAGFIRVEPISLRAVARSLEDH